MTPLVPSPRPAQLVYTHVLANKDTSQAITVVAESADGIPMGWLLCFGGRNFWEPDDHVSDRGGQSAERSRFETPLDVAEARLRTAIDSVRGVPHLWVWFASLELLHRRVLARGKRGFLQLRAPWALGDAALHAKANEALAWAENYVNLASNDRAGDVGGKLGPMPELCPFVPRCVADDAKQFEKLTLYHDLAPAVRAAALVGGLPAGDPSKFAALVEQQYAPTFATLHNLAPYPKPTPTPPSASKTALPKQATSTKPSASKTAVPKQPATPPAPKTAPPKPAPPAPTAKPAGTSTAATEQKPAGLLGKLKGLLGK